MSNFNPVPKFKTYRNRKYLDWIQGQPCIICGSRETVPHHIRHIYWGSGVANKSHDYVSVPLCAKHHNDEHSMPFLDKSLVNIERIIIEFLMRYIEKSC